LERSSREGRANAEESERWEIQAEEGKTSSLWLIETTPVIGPGQDLGGWGVAGCGAFSCHHWPITRSCVDSILPGWPARAHCQYGLLRQNYRHKVWLHNIGSTIDWAYTNEFCLSLGSSYHQRKLSLISNLLLQFCCLRKNRCARIKEYGRLMISLTSLRARASAD
jgi:hypothetical protein